MEIILTNHVWFKVEITQGWSGALKPLSTDRPCDELVINKTKRYHDNSRHLIGETLQLWKYVEKKKMGKILNIFWF